MNRELLNAIYAHGPDNPVARYVLIVIADHVNTPGQVAFPSQRRLADLTRLSLPTVQRAVRRLEEDGFLIVSRQMLGGRRKANRYLINTLRLGMGSPPDDAIAGNGGVAHSRHDHAVLSSDDHAVLSSDDHVALSSREAMTTQRCVDDYTVMHKSAIESAKQLLPAASSSNVPNGFVTMLERHGINHFKTAERLWAAGIRERDDEWIARHLEAAERRGEGVGMVITRLLAREEPPGRRKQGQERPTLENQVPLGLEDVIVR